MRCVKAKSWCSSPCRGLDAPTNAHIREYMMSHPNLAGVARLLNNLFTDNTGTEVGSETLIKIIY